MIKLRGLGRRKRDLVLGLMVTIIILFLLLALQTGEVDYLIVGCVWICITAVYNWIYDNLDD